MALSNMDPNCACDLPCGECGTDEFKDDDFYDHFNEDDNEWEDDRCCYQFGGPKECHCARITEEEARRNHWLYGLSYRLWSRWFLIKDKCRHLRGKYFPSKLVCDSCKYKFDVEHDNCPKCGESHLPF